jgi:formiminotetrahydrofolate cyclodeaminase
MRVYRVRFTDYLDDLAKNNPSPGGGSAVCLIFCMGVSLIEKAINYSLGENGHFKKHMFRLKELRKEIIPYIDLDGKIFEKLLKEKGKKKAALLKASENIIIDLGGHCVKVFSLAKRVESGIKKSIISDFYIGLEFIRVALKGCIFNLEANKSIFGKSSKSINTFNSYLKKWRRF